MSLCVIAFPWYQLGIFLHPGPLWVRQAVLVMLAVLAHLLSVCWCQTAFGSFQVGNWPLFYRVFISMQTSSVYRPLRKRSSTETIETQAQEERQVILLSSVGQSLLRVQAGIEEWEKDSPSPWKEMHCHIAKVVHKWREKSRTVFTVNLLQFPTA